MEPSIPLSHSVAMCQASNTAGVKVGTLDGVVLGLGLAALIAIAAVLMGASRSSMDLSYSAHLGAIPQPSEKPTSTSSRSVIAPLTNPLVPQGWCG